MMKYLADKGYEIDFSGSHWKMKMSQHRHFTRLDTLDERLTPDSIRSCLGGTSRYGNYKARISCSPHMPEQYKNAWKAHQKTTGILALKQCSFKRMIEDIEDGKINCVVTKDLSRLGRNYILTGQYTEIYFPSKGVRYIAIHDGVDTIREDNDIAPFKNIVNEWKAFLELICLNVANGFTYFLQDFKLQGSKLRCGGSHFLGEGVIRWAVLVQTAGNLIQIPADFSILGCELPNGRKQFIIDWGNGDNRAYS